jgi:hypothetical protein
MSLDLIPRELRARFRFDERHHACAILKTDFSNQWKDLLDCLRAFSLKRSHILKAGGGRGPIAATLDGFLQTSDRGWKKHRFDVRINVDGVERVLPTHEIDNFKGRVGVEVEWNNKTEFYDRDLNNFRLLHQIGVLSVGVIITRQSELRPIFSELGKWESYGTTSTHWDKLIPKIDGGGAGGCPLQLIGMGPECYDPNS